MHINAINYNYNTNNKYNRQQEFKGLIIDRSAIPVINSMSKSDVMEFNKLKRRLSKMKFWDMKLSSIGNQFKEFKFQFIDKRNNRMITDGIYPYDKQGNTIKIYSIIYGPENISTNMTEGLTYKSDNRARKIYDNYIQNLEIVRLKNFKLTPIESLRCKEIEIKMLEEASHFMEKNKTNYLNTEISTKTNIGNTFKL